METVGDSDICSQIVLKCLYLARIGGPDIQEARKISHKMDSGL